LTSAEHIDVPWEVAAIRETLEARRDPSYEWGMHRTVPSALPAHSTRVPDIRKISSEWARSHSGASGGEVITLAEALWATGWREEMIAAVMLIARSRSAMEALSWESIERWSEQIDNWEHVDSLAGEVTGPLLRQKPELRSDVAKLGSSAHSWQRRLAIVTLIVAVRTDASWQPELEAMTSSLQGDRGPTMRKALDWARRVLKESEAGHV
jgi:3-methyladenine DNA glycosylase AlkD